MSEENINIATKEYADAHFGNTSETNDNLVIATKEYVDSIPPGMVMDGTALKGLLFNPCLATSVGEDADGSTLVDGTRMFLNCTTLTSWTTDLPNLTSGSSMFNGCTGLTSWAVDLLSLTNGFYMFSGCSGLTSWTAALPNLTEGTNMFTRCSNLTSWTTALPKLTNGNTMFSTCTALTSWNVDLPRLTNGTAMFSGCNLDEPSVLRILNSIPTYTSGTHNLQLGKRTNYLNSTDIAALLNTTTPIAATNYSYKGWTITVQA